MNLFRPIFNIIWGILFFLIPFGLLRVITKASYNDFSGSGTIIYTTMIIIYVIVTVLLSVICSKKYLYFLVLLVILCMVYPLLLIYFLNNFKL